MVKSEKQVTWSLAEPFWGVKYEQKMYILPQRPKKCFSLNFGGEGKAWNKNILQCFISFSLAGATPHFPAYTVLENGPQASCAGQFLGSHTYLFSRWKLTSLKSLSKGKEVGLSVTCLGQPDFTADSRWRRRRHPGVDRLLKRFGYQVKEIETDKMRRASESQWKC